MPKLTISPGNMKLGNIPNVSLPPIKSCPNCKLCAKKCYAMKAYRQYPATRKAWDGNLALWKKNAGTYWGLLYQWLVKHKPKYFRFHVGGDSPDITYMQAAMGLAALFPKTQFLMFTKAFDQLAYDTPYLNTHIILSRWPGDTKPNRECFAQAWVYDPKNQDIRIPWSTGYICPGSCEKCKKCFHAVAGDNIIFKVH